MSAVETAFITNMIGIFGGNILLFSLFTIMMFIILIALFHLPAIFTIPISIFVGSLFVTAGFAQELAFPIVIIAGFIIAVGIILKVWG